MVVTIGWKRGAQTIMDPGLTAEITRLYAAAFNRQPDAAGLAFWVGNAQNGMSLDDIAGDFASSPEFLLTYGNTTDDQLVTLLYQNVLGRPPEAAGEAAWDNLLANGVTRGRVLDSFAQSPENVIHTAQINDPPPVTPAPDPPAPQPTPVQP